jgi:hypothetical protein
MPFWSCAVLHSAGSWPRAMPHNAGSWLSSMPHSAGSSYKFYTKKSLVLCRIARDHDPALCQHNAGPHIFVYVSENSQQNSKILYSMNQGPRCDCFMKKKPEVKNLATLTLQIKVPPISLGQGIYILCWCSLCTGIHKHYAVCMIILLGLKEITIFNFVLNGKKMWSFLEIFPYRIIWLSLKY